MTTVKTKDADAGTTRIVLDIPNATMERFKLLCSLVGDTQGGVVTKALDTYIDERKEAIDQFMKLRKQIS